MSWELFNWSKRVPLEGDHIRVDKFFYSHHGIYISDKEVIHFSTEESSCDNVFSKSRVIATSLREFEGTGSFEVRDFSASERKQLYSPKEIVSRARSKLGEKNYSLFSNNCEHFANWCVMGVHKSQQVKTALELLSIIENFIIR